MADTEYTVERYENGVLVDTRTFPKPAEQWAEETLTERATAALSGNAEFLALASPTNAQAVAQIRALTRQVNGIIRLQLRALDTIDDA